MPAKNTYPFTICIFTASMLLMLFPYLTVNFLASDIHSQENETTFSWTLQNDDKTILNTGSSDYSKTTSSYSIHMNGDNGICAIHLLNIRTLEEAEYDVQNREEVTTGAICIIEENETRKRFASASGTFVITEYSPGKDLIKGHFDMKMIRNGEKLRWQGEVESKIRYRM